MDHPDRYLGAGVFFAFWRKKMEVDSGAINGRGRISISVVLFSGDETQIFFDDEVLALLKEKISKIL